MEHKYKLNPGLTILIFNVKLNFVIIEIIINTRIINTIEINKIIINTIEIHKKMIN